MEVQSPLLSFVLSKATSQDYLAVYPEIKQNEGERARIDRSHLCLFVEDW